MKGRVSALHKTVLNKTVTGSPYWTAVHTPPEQFPWLDHDEYCEVAVIGAGITGTLCADRFAQAGIDTVLMGEKPIGYGATSCSQGVISYQLERGILHLAQKVGMDKAVKIYELCAATVGAIENLCDNLETDVEFARRDALYFTSCESKSASMSEEFLARHHNGFDTEYISGEKSQQSFSFPVAAGIYSTGLTAVCNPYLLAHSLAVSAESAGARVYENSPVCQITGEKDSFKLQTATNRTVSAKKVIMAAGMESAKQLPFSTYKKMTFTIVTAPVADFSGWLNNAVICEEGQNAVRLRTTEDNRIIISGLDCGIPSIKRISSLMQKSALSDKKFAELNDLLVSMFPGIREITPEFQYFHEYLQVDDSLPVIGEKEDSGILYAMCPGENGIAFASIAADLLLDEYKGQSNPNSELFGFDR